MRDLFFIWAIMALLTVIAMLFLMKAGAYSAAVDHPELFSLDQRRWAAKDLLITILVAPFIAAFWFVVFPVALIVSLVSLARDAFEKEGS